jgi:hypothetical protein
MIDFIETRFLEAVISSELTILSNSIDYRYSFRLIPNIFEVIQTYSSDYSKEANLIWPDWISKITNVR